MRVAIEFLISFFLLVGGFFGLVGAIGLVRLPDFLMRLHGPTKATTLGVGGVLIAAMLYFVGSGRWVVHELLIAAFLFVTAPVSALMLAKAGIHERLASRAPLPPPETDEEKAG
jgi:multicomponent K+:H+ antiporter subunit G